MTETTSFIFRDVLKCTDVMEFRDLTKFEDLRKKLSRKKCLLKKKTKYRFTYPNKYLMDIPPLEKNK